MKEAFFCLIVNLNSEDVSIRRTHDKNPSTYFCSTVYLSKDSDESLRKLFNICHECLMTVDELMREQKNKKRRKINGLHIYGVCWAIKWL